MRVDPDSFEAPYARDGDPWQFASSPYELQRYATTIGLIDRTPRHARCFEPGCSIGVLTEQLASRCDEVVAVDPSPSAIRSAGERLAGVTNVELHVGSLPEWWPEGSFDLVVMSELGYYWDREGLADLTARLGALRTPAADFVAVHWLGSSPDHLLHGNEVQEILTDVLGTPDETQVHEQFTAAAWRR
jgi:SAM-dependent methyltransferase